MLRNQKHTNAYMGKMTLRLSKKRGRFTQSEHSGMDIPVFRSFIKTEWNKGEVDLLNKIFGDYVDKIYVFDCGCQCGENDIKSLIEHGFVLPENLKASATVPCPMIFNRLHITTEGYLDACCVDMNNYLAIADLHTVSLKQAWDSPIFRELRKNI